MGSHRSRTVCVAAIITGCVCALTWFVLVPRTALAPIKVGILHSETGTMATSERAVHDATLMEIAEIQEATNHTVSLTEQGAHSINETTEVVTRADATIRTLPETIGDAAHAATQIVAAVAQRAAALSQISQSMPEIEKEARHSLESSRRAERLAQERNQLGGELMSLIGSDV